MTYLSDLADKEVESVEPYVGDYEGAKPFPGIAEVWFTDGTRMSVHIDSRSFYYQGAEVSLNDYYKAFDHRIPTIYSPEPPPFRFPKDPALKEIVQAFKTMRQKLDGYYGSHHKDANAEFEEIVGPWKAAVQRYFGYRRGNNLTSEEGVFIQANERRPKWLLKLSNWLPTKVFATTSPR